jgi:hypothetical protein
MTLLTYRRMRAGGQENPWWIFGRGIAPFLQYLFQTALETIQSPINGFRGSITEGKAALA